MTSCVCGKAGFANRRGLATHIQTDHQVGNPVRALMLADKRVEGKEYSPEECAVLGVEPTASTPPPPERQIGRAVAGPLPGVPTDADLNRAIETAEASSHFAPPPAVARAPRPRRARVAQTVERRPSMAEAARSTRAPRSSSTPAPPAISPAPQETPMPKKVDSADCKVCARLTKKAGTPTKCKRHGGAGHPKSRTKPTGGGASKKPKPGKAAAVSRNGAGKIDAMLTEAKASVTTLREELRRAELRVEVLTELAGV